jgi:hypothetical protein
MDIFEHLWVHINNNAHQKERTQDGVEWMAMKPWQLARYAQIRKTLSVEGTMRTMDRDQEQLGFMRA